MVEESPVPSFILTEEQVAEYKEVFSFYDKDCDGLIPTHELGSYLRSVGLNPSQEEISELVEDFKSNDDKSIDLTVCLQVIANKLKEPPETEDSLREAFRTFDRDGVGYLTVIDFQQVMTQHGEKLSEDDVQEMIALVDDGSGVIRYEELSKIILSKRSEMARIPTEF